MGKYNFDLFNILNESDCGNEKQELKEATTDVNEVTEEYTQAYNKELDLSRVPCVIARDTMLSGWGGATGKNHYQIILCGDTTEAANIEYTMKREAKSEGLSNIRRTYGVKVPSNSSASYVVGRYASAWNDLSDSWYEDRYGNPESSEEQTNEGEDCKNITEDESVSPDLETISDIIVNVINKNYADEKEEIIADLYNMGGGSQSIDDVLYNYDIEELNSVDKENINRNELANLLISKLENASIDECELKEDTDTAHKMKDCTDDVDIINALEGDVLVLEDIEDWNRLKALVRGLAPSQGFYSRLYAEMNEYPEDQLEFPMSL